MVAEGGIEPPADGAYETPALPTELFRRRRGWARTTDRQIQSLPRYRLRHSPIVILVPSRGFEPLSSDLKDRGPGQLVDDGVDLERAASNDLASSVWRTEAHPSIPYPHGGALRARFSC